jgi:hypothetical protein
MLSCRSITGIVICLALSIACSSAKPLKSVEEKNKIVTSYPKWFLEPELCNSASAAGYLTPGYYLDSSAALAFQKALFNAVRFQQADISASDDFWATEAGVYWITTDFEDIIDSSRYSYFESQFSPVDTFYNKSMVAVLVAKNSVLDPECLKRITPSTTNPSWIETLPQKKGYLYAVGVSPRYFHEKSSWDNATNQVRKQLAVSIAVQIQAVQKRTDVAGVEQRNRELSVTLQEFEILRRWVDPKTDLFYVLGRIPR